MRCYLGLLVCLAIGCGGKPLDREQALKKLKTQADEVGRAMLTPDHARMADLSHPTSSKGWEVGSSI